MKKKVLKETREQLVARKRENFLIKESNINMQKKAGIISEQKARLLLSEAREQLYEFEDIEDEADEVESGMDDLKPDVDELEGETDELEGDLDGDMAMGPDDDLPMEFGDEEGGEVDLSNPEDLAARLADRIADVIEDTLRVNIDVEADGVPLDDMGDDIDSGMGGPEKVPDIGGDDDLVGDEDEDELMEEKNKNKLKKVKTSKMDYSVPDQKMKAAPKSSGGNLVKEELARKVAKEIARTLLEARSQKATKKVTKQAPAKKSAPAPVKKNLNESDGSTYGVSTPMRKIGEMSNERFTVRIYRNVDWEEYVVKPFINGKTHEDSWTFLDDKADAVEHAKYLIAHPETKFPAIEGGE